MSTLALFVIGCLVSLIVCSAVGLLLWGAWHEQRDAESEESRREVARSASRPGSEPLPAPAYIGPSDRK